MHKVIPVCEPCQQEEREKKESRAKRRKKAKKKKDPWADSSSDSDNGADRTWAKKLTPAIIKVRSPLVPVAPSRPQTP